MKKTSHRWAKYMLHTCRTMSLALPVSAMAVSCPTDIPPYTSPTPVADKAVVNGLSMQILMLTSTRSPRQILADAEQRWKDKGHLVKRVEMGPWDIVSVIGEGCMTSLQLMERGGAVGYYALSRPAKASEQSLKTLVVPGNAILESAMKSFDDRQDAITSTFTSKKTPREMRDTYVADLKDHGWQSVKSFELRDKNGRDAYTIKAQRSDNHLSAIVWHTDTTHMMVQITETQ